MPAGYIFWDINPEIINVLGISIRYYGLLFVSGLILCLYILSKIFKTENISQNNLEKLAIYGLIGIIAGARLGHCLFYEPDYYFSHPLEMFLSIQAKPDGGYMFTGYQGLASHGGALGLITVLVIYSKRTKQSILNILDLLALITPLGGCFIRIANLMNSEIIGLPTTKPWAFIFARVDNIPRHPTQLYEAVSYLLIFLIMLYLYKTYRDKLRNGAFFGLVLILIFLARFFIEFFKENQVGFEQELVLNMGQILSIPYIASGLGFFVFGIIRTKKNKSN